MIYREMTTAGGAATSAVRLLLNLVRELMQRTVCYELEVSRSFD